MGSAQAIRHLVAAAIPGMKVEKVSVMNTDGTLLMAGDDASNQSSGRLATLEKTVGLEIQDSVRRTLAPYLGIGNFEISVAARLNTDKVNTSETIFNPGTHMAQFSTAWLCCAPKPSPPPFAPRITSGSVSCPPVM